MKVKEHRNEFIDSTLPISPCLHATGEVNQYFYFILFNHKTIQAQLITTSSQEYRHNSSQKPTLGRNKTKQTVGNTRKPRCTQSSDHAYMRNNTKPNQ